MRNSCVNDCNIVARILCELGGSGYWVRVVKVFVDDQARAIMLANSIRDEKARGTLRARTVSDEGDVELGRSHGGD